MYSGGEDKKNINCIDISLAMPSLLLYTPEGARTNYSRLYFA